MLEDPTNPRFGDSFKQLFGTEPEDVNWNDEAIQERLKTLPKFSLRFQVLTADCLDPSKSFQKLVKKPYSAIVIDTIYEFDHGPSSEDLALIDADQEQPTTVDDLQKMLNTFKDLNLTTDNMDYTVIVFCSFSQVSLFSYFLDVFVAFLSFFILLVVFNSGGQVLRPYEEVVYKTSSVALFLEEESC